MDHKEGVRRIRHIKARQIGEGNGDESINLQRVHQGDGIGIRRCPSSLHA